MIIVTIHYVSNCKFFYDPFDIFSFSNIIEYLLKGLKPGDYWSEVLLSGLVPLGQSSEISF